MKSPPVADAPLFCLTHERKSQVKLRWIILINMQSVVGTRGINCVPYLRAVYKLRRQGNIQRLNEVRDVLIGASKQTCGAMLQDVFFSSPCFSITEARARRSTRYSRLSQSSTFVVLVVVVLLCYDSASTTCIHRLHLLHNAARIFERAFHQPRSSM